MNDSDNYIEFIAALENGELSPSPQVLALLQEIQDMLVALCEYGEPNSIDVRSLPLAPGDYDFLRAFFDEGEVSASINTLGMSEIKETRYSGVWWIKHYNTEEQIVAELIEVTPLPDILKTQVPDLNLSLGTLQDHLEKLKTQR